VEKARKRENPDQNHDQNSTRNPPETQQKSYRSHGWSGAYQPDNQASPDLQMRPLSSAGRHPYCISRSWKAWWWGWGVPGASFCLCMVSGCFLVGCWWDVAEFWLDSGKTLVGVWSDSRSDAGPFVDP
jgi:hypothetical protein